jgi:hypothetical protein
MNHGKKGRIKERRMRRIKKKRKKKETGKTLNNI